MRNLGHAVFELKYHIILVTKYRRPVLTDEIAERLKKETERLITESFNGQVIEMETDMDHIHILAEISPRYSIAEVVNVLKGVTSRILKSEYAESFFVCYFDTDQFVAKNDRDNFKAIE